MAEPTPRTSFDPSRHPGQASTSTPARGQDAAVPERPQDSAATVATAGLWLLFPVLLAVALIIGAVLVMAR